MTAVVLAHTDYLASNEIRWVTPPADNGPRRAERVRQLVGHLVRNGFTLCGRHASTFRWVEPDATAVRCGICASVPPGHATHRDMCAVGISYRQLDYWCRLGWLRPDPGCGGSGSLRTFPLEELAAVQVMAALTAAGVTPKAAHRVARGGDLAPGITVTVHHTGEARW